MVEIATENTDRLIRLINDILDLERMESGVVVLQRDRLSAAELVRAGIDGAAALAAAADVDLHHGDVEGMVIADAERIVQTLHNLLTNAVKFSPPASTVVVSAGQEGSEVVFRVADEGRGIPSDQLKSIFERFQQADASDRRHAGGTGLGLAICRSIVEHHGGRIWAASGPGGGATFSFTLPAAPEVG